MSKILTDRALLEQALEALTWCEPEGAVVTAARSAAIDALRAALFQKDQDPVAWMYRDIGVVRFAEKLPSPGMHKTESVALYTHPPRREWQGLTEEEREKAIRWAIDLESTSYSRTLARAIEAKLKERNHG